LKDGLWVALDSFAAELVTRDLDADLAENPQLDIFIATPCRSTSLVEVIRRGWDLEDLRARDEAFLTRWEYLDMCETHWALTLLMLFCCSRVNSDSTGRSDHASSSVMQLMNLQSCRRLHR
jgi:hypothetical protein